MRAFGAIVVGAIVLTTACGGAASERAMELARVATDQPAPTSTPRAVAATAVPALAAATATPDPASRLAGGAAALPAVAPGVPFIGHLLISDVGNRRIVEIDPAGEMTWSFPAAGDAAAAALAPWDDAYYSPGGATITANSAATSTVIAIDVATRQIRWRAGIPNTPSKGDKGFSSPDDAATALDGSVWVADILNCRVVHLSPSGGFLGALGDGRCVHAPPASFTSPNAAYPMADGGLLVTEINGSWIDRLAPDGSLLWSVHAPVTYPSDAVPYPDGSVLVADYVSPGQVLRIARDGTVVWRFDAGRQLHNPSSVQPIASNRVAISDDFGGRILIVDPTTNEIVRQYTTAGGVRFKITDCVDFRPD